MSGKNLVNAVAEVAEELHRGQTDRAGVDYFKGHLSTVAANVSSNTTKCVGYLHDSLEDIPSMTPWNLCERLALAGLPLEWIVDIVDAVKVLTRKPGEEYFEYLENVANHPIARDVKIADMTHNSDLSRIKNPNKYDRMRRDKYMVGILYLKTSLYKS